MGDSDHDDRDQIRGLRGRMVEATSPVDAKDRAYGPFLTWEDVHKLRKAVEEQTRGLEDHQMSLRANTSAVDMARDTNAELIKAIDRLAELLAPKPA